jgi:hypothetical protein
MTDLKVLAKEMGKAEREALAAKRAMKLDKRARKGSIVGRIEDFVCETDAEENSRIADETLATLRETSIKAVRDFIDVEAIRYLRQEGDDVEEWTREAALTAGARGAAETAQALYEAAEKAVSAFVNAASACHSASTMETMDAVTNNPGIAAMSTVSTGNAKTAVHTANTAHEEFVRLYGATQALVDPIHAPDDMMDFLLDLAMPSSFDILSIVNVGRLSSIAAACDEAAGRLVGARDTVRRTLEERTVPLDERKSALLSIEMPYRERAAATVPPELRFAVPEYPDFSARPAHGEAGPRTRYQDTASRK